MQHVHRGHELVFFYKIRRKDKYFVAIDTTDFKKSYYCAMKKKSPNRQTITMYKAVTDTQLVLPFVEDGIKAGFASPATDYEERGIDLNRELIKNPSSTFLAKVDGNCLTQSFIIDGDVAIIDKSLEVRDGCKVVAFIDGEFAMKTIRMDEKDVIYLVPDDPEYPTIKVTSENEFMIWGVVTYVIHKLY